MFTDSIDGNTELLRELLRGLPPYQRRRAAEAAAHVEKAVMALRKEHPKDNAVATGVAFAVHVFAQAIVQSKAEPGESSLIQTL